MCTYVHVDNNRLIFEDKCCLYAEPSGSPLSVKFVHQIPNEVTIQWEKLKCHEENGPITGYRYRIYRDLLHFSEGTVHENMITVSLFDSTAVAFSVAAENEASVGEFSPPVSCISVHSEAGERNY